MLGPRSLALFSSLLVLACSGTPGRQSEAPSGSSSGSSSGAYTGGTAAGVASVLDDWHAAASEADGSRYFAHFADDAVFLGSDASERWTAREFREAYGPFMAEGRGWTCVPRDRFVSLSSDGRLAWIDELLDHSSYGVWRGTGVLRWDGAAWKIVHYSMTFTVPNEVSRQVVELCEGAAGEG